MGYQLAADEDSNNSPANDGHYEDGIVEDGDEIVGIDMEEAVSSPEHDEAILN